MCVQLCDLTPSPSIEQLYILYQAAQPALVQVPFCMSICAGVETAVIVYLHLSLSTSVCVRTVELSGV